MNKCQYCDADVKAGFICSKCGDKLPAVKHLVKQFELIKAAKTRRDERLKKQKGIGKY